MTWRLKLFLIVAMLFPMALLSGCFSRSLHPLYTGKDSVFDAALLGNWTDSNRQESCNVTRAGRDHYSVVYTDNAHKQGEFVAHLVSVKGAKFLDLFPVETKFSQGDLYALHFLPVYSFFRVVHTQPSPQLAELSEDWLQVFLSRYPAAIRHEEVNDGIYLTAPPREIQRFLIAHLITKGAFAPDTPWQRKEPPVPEHLEHPSSVSVRLLQSGGVK